MPNRATTTHADHAGHADDDTAASSAVAPPGGAGSAIDRLTAVVPESMLHLHDSEESATFFTSEVKATLKRMLSAM